MAALATNDHATDPGTWTLVSLAGGGASMKVWHQHGAGTVPVPMEAVSVSSSRVPSAQGRSFVCPECDDLTVVGVPTS
jgi:hypothetical protein